MAPVRIAFVRGSAPAAEPATAPSARKEATPLVLDQHSRARRFEQIFTPHLDAAYDFARWLTRDERNAEDVVQEACLRAFKSLDGFQGETARAWLLAIVRNTYYTWFRRNKAAEASVPFDDDTELAASEASAALGSTIDSIDRVLQQRDARRLVNAALERLPEEFREVIVLRELEDLSYKEIAAIASIPIGTVMSRLARARKLMLQHLQHTRES
jgi:RNA polymerase sigma-70 factor (ECF subfamily)